MKKLIYGYYHTALITTNGKLYVWGDNIYGSLGIGSISAADDKTTPYYHLLNNSERFVDVTCAQFCTFAVTENGDVYSWGRDSWGILGHGTLDVNLSTPKVIDYFVTNNIKIVSLKATFEHIIVLDSNGNVYTWGYNVFGQLGLGDTTYRSTPTKIASLSNITHIAAGNYHSGAVDKDGNIYTWGYNYYGQLGLNSSSTSFTTPQLMMNLPNVKKLFFGGQYSGVLTTDGELRLWGYNVFGQLGTNNTTTQRAPILLGDYNSGFNDIVDFALGYEQTMIVRSNGTAYSFGYNAYSRLMLGNITNYSTPQLVPNIANRTAITCQAGYESTWIIDSMHKIISAGYNVEGTLGDGTRINTSSTKQYAITQFPP